jgi:hypothetical protein
LNAGAHVSQGDVLLFQHADNCLCQGAAAQIREALASPETPGGAFRQWIEASGWRYRLLEAGNACRVRWIGLPYGDQAIFLRRALFFELGGFPEVPLLEDLLLMQRVRRHGRVALLPGPLHVSARRWERYGVLRQTLRNWTLLAGFAAGIPLERLASYYRRHDLPP